jgi:hypothetical protein
MASVETANVGMFHHEMGECKEGWYEPSGGYS